MNGIQGPGPLYCCGLVANTYPLCLDLGARTRTGYDASSTRTCIAGCIHKNNPALLFTILCEIRTILGWCLAHLSNTICAVSRVFARLPRPWRIMNKWGTAWISRGKTPSGSVLRGLLEKHINADGVSSAVVVLSHSTGKTAQDLKFCL